MVTTLLLKFMIQSFHMGKGGREYTSTIQENMVRTIKEKRAKEIGGIRYWLVSRNMIKTQFYRFAKNGKDLVNLEMVTTF